MSVLGRLRLAGGISAAGRFFGTSVGDSLLKFIQNAGLDARTFGALFGQSNEVGINNGSAPVVTGTVSPVAMVLLPEMYNGMARAVNAINRASPLNWRCLRWNVFGKSVGLDTASTFGLFFNGSWDPNTNTTSGAVFQDTGSLKSGVGVPGFAYQCSNSGSTPLDGNSGWVPGDVATFTIAGQWVKSHPSVLSNSQIWGNYAGIMPMSCFSTFDAGSQYEALCGVIGIAVRTASDFPPAATGQAFTDLQNAIVGRGVLIDMVRCVSSTATVDLSSAPPAATSATLTGEIISDLLSAKKLIAGQVTGTQCLGTWTDSLLQLGTSYLVNAGYGDIGKYWVVPDDASSLLGAIKRGDLVMINGFSGDPSTTLYGTVSLSPMATLLNKQKGVTLAGVDLNIYSTAGGGIRWITITDVQSAVEALGFQFSYTEQLIPMALYHYDEPYVGNVIFSQSRGPVLASGTSNAVLGSTYIPSSFSIVAGSDPKLGNWIKFVVSGDGGALWKSRNFEEVFGVNPIADLNPNAGHSPIMVLTNGKMVFDPSLHVGAGIGPVFQLGGGQHVGASGDDVSTTPDVSSTYFAGYKVTVYDPTGPADIINQTPTISDRGFEVCAPYLEGVHDRQFYTQAFLVQNSAGFQAFPTQVVLLPNEAWTRPASWWTQSLFNANWYQDLIGNGPWQYLAPTGSTTRITLSNGLTVVAPPGTNAFYNLLTNVGPPIIEM